MSIVHYGNYSNAPRNAIHQFQDSRIEETIPASLIVDGAITANKIAANAITADKIQTGAITIGSDGRLGGAGTGQVTIGGLGYTGDLNATRGAVAGVNLSDASGANLSDLDIRNNVDGIIRAPLGGYRATTNSVETGAICIQLPLGWSSTMLKFTVDIYEYAAGYSCSIEVSGYNSDPWRNCTARVLGGSNVEYPVRFGVTPDGSYCAVYIGDANDTWSYPQIRVKDVLVGYANYQRSRWESGWNIFFAAPTSISAEILDTLPGADYSKGKNNPTTLAAINTGESNKLGGIENNATRGAPSGTNVGTIDAGLLDSRVYTATMSQDTRNDNQAPQYYIDRAYISRVFNEFKYLGVMGIPNPNGDNGSYGQLTTTLPWGDLSGGPIHQEIRDEQGRYWNRRSTSASSWAAWTDTGGQINYGVTTINGGKITTGSVTANQIAANTITGDKIAANTVTASLLTTATRPFAFYNLRFAVGNDGILSWGDGYVQYQSASGSYVSEYCNAGSITNNGSMRYLYYVPGSANISATTDEGNQINPNVFQIGQWNGTKFGLTVRAGVGTFINGDQILTGSVNADRIIARTITADKIASNSITTNEIAANAVTANRLSAATKPFSIFGMQFRVDNDGYLRWNGGYVQYVNADGNYASVEVVGGSIGSQNTSVQYLYYTPGAREIGVTADESIQANQNVFFVGKWHNNKSGLILSGGVGTLINGDQILTGSVHADRIIARTISADKLAAGSITANEIATGAITANQIAANTITGDKIVAGTISAAQIATGAITARVLATGNPDSIVPDSNFNDALWWGQGDARIGVRDQIGFSDFNRCITIYPQGGIDVYSYFFPVEPGATYRITTSVYSGDISGSFTPYIHMPGWQYWPMRQDGRYDIVAGSASGSWTYTVTNSTALECRQWQFRFTGSWTGTVNFACKIVRVSDTTLIKDGSITTDKIVVNSLNGDRITAGTLSADKITAGSITTDRLSLGMQSKVLNNLLTTNFWGRSWTEAPAGWVQNNSAANQWTIGLSPAGGTEKMLKMVASGGDANGGWNVNIGPADGWSRDKAYRYYTWVYAEDGADNSIYHGCDYIQNMQGGDLGNPYFFSFSKTQIARNKWYLMVGYIHPANSGAGDSGLSGLYDPVTGQRVFAGNEYRWRPDATVGAFRSYQYYGGDGGVAYFTKPVVEEVVAGQTPSIRSLFQYMDFAQNINTGSTQILPGMINISGGTTLASWRDGGDTTKIAGGAISANSIRTNSLQVGDRGLNYIGLQFEYNAPNVIKWTSGYVLWTDDNGSQQASPIDANSWGWQGGSFNYIYWDKTNPNTLSVGADNWSVIRANPNQVLLCTWEGSSAKFVANYGGTIVHGDNITTGSINANRIVAGTITATQIAGGSISGDRIAANTITGYNIQAGSISADRIKTNEIVIGGSQIQGGTALPNNLTISGTGTTLGTINAVVQDPAYYINLNSTTISGGKITTGSITAAQIQANSITADRLSVGSLSAISGTIGTLRTATTGGRMELSDNVIKIFDENGVLRAKIGNLAL